MGTIIVFMIIIGLCLIIASFIFFEKDDIAKKQVVTLNDYELNEEELAKLQENLREVVKEYSDQLVADTEKDLNSVSTSKMLAINELTEQALDDIKKSHQECVFLYDMLEDKSAQLKQYVSNSAEKLLSMQENIMRAVPEEHKSEVENVLQETTMEQQVREHLKDQVEQNEILSEDLLGENAEEVADVQERNKQILKMYEDGKAPLDIAKELDLGVGEVQLVVDLFQEDEA